MFQLIYISSAIAGMGAGACGDILASARANNRAAGVTGLLLFNGRRFLQVLEGDEEQVRGVFGKVRQDSRHRAIVLLATNDVDEREFGAWDMAFERADAAALSEQVELLLDRAGPSIQALFRTTATMHRQAG